MAALWTSGTFNGITYRIAPGANGVGTGMLATDAVFYILVFIRWII